MRRVTIQGGKFILEFPYSLGILQAIRSLPGRAYNTNKRNWSVPATQVAARNLFDIAQEHGFKFDEPALDTLAGLLAEADVLAEASATAASDFRLSVTLGKSLFPYQVAGVEYALRAMRCFIGDEMGLGKTAQLLGAIEEGSLYPAIVVCPASLKTNWKRECAMWIPNRHAVVLGSSKEDVAAATRYADIVIVNYELIIAKRGRDKRGKHTFPVVELLRQLKPKAIGADESHYIKNPEALRSEACVKLAQGVENLYCLTGTPVTNKPLDFVGQLKFLNRLEELGGYWPFVKRYCGAKKTRYGWDFSGSSNAGELNRKLRETCYIRRLKSEVLKDLPPKAARTVYFSFDLKEYHKATAQALETLAYGVSLLEADKHISGMKLQASLAKLPAVIEWVQNFLDSGRKLVLFAWHREIIRQLRAAFPDISVSIAGDTSTEIDQETGLNDRQRAVDAFQENDFIRLFIGNIKAAGVGLTLTAASDVAFMEFVHSPKDHEQAEDRVHRHGQTEAVTVWYLVGEGTIDEEIIESLGIKQAVIDEVCDGAYASTKNRTVMKDILKRLLKT